MNHGNVMRRPVDLVQNLLDQEQARLVELRVQAMHVADNPALGGVDHEIHLCEETMTNLRMELRS